jgi:hypothetical protein
LVGSFGPTGGCTNCEDSTRRWRMILLENQRLQQLGLAQSNRIQDLEEQLVSIRRISPEVLNNGIIPVSTSFEVAEQFKALFLQLKKTEEPKQEPSRFGVLEVDELDLEEK